MRRVGGIPGLQRARREFVDRRPVGEEMVRSKNGESADTLLADAAEADIEVGEVGFEAGAV